MYEKMANSEDDDEEAVRVKRLTTGPKRREMYLGLMKDARKELLSPILPNSSNCIL